MSTGAVLVDRIGDDLALITLNRRDRLNAIDDSFVTGLHAALDRIESDAGVRAVVLTGAGRGFCAGADLKEIPDLADRTPAELYRGQQRLADLSVRRHELLVPVVAAVNGRARATELLLSGRRLDAAEAFAWGFDNRVVDPEGDVVAEASALARSVADNPAFGVRLTKEMLRSTGTAASLREAVLLENRTQVLAAFAGDIDEATERFRRGSAHAATRSPDEPGRERG